MHSRQLEQLARQRSNELTATSQAGRIPQAWPARPTRSQATRRQIKTHTGWALVQIGLRLAASDSH